MGLAVGVGVVLLAAFADSLKRLSGLRPYT